MIQKIITKESKIVQVPVKTWYAALGSLSVLREDSKRFVDRAIDRGTDIQGDVLSQLGALSQKLRAKPTKKQTAKRTKATRRKRR